ncbi:MAG: potassium/proton antiporter [Bacteroidales bacterium]
MNIAFNSEIIVFIGAIILFLSILAGKASFRLGLPTLLLFLGIGMLFGSDGLGIQFSNPITTQFIGMLALSIILFSGGMDTKISEIKPIATPGVLLATVGVLLTTLITGTFIYLISQNTGHYITLTFPQSLLLAAVMSSTDSASVFSILRSKNIHLKERLRPTLELESGSNDPMAYMLTILLIAYIQQGGMDTADALLSFITQLSVGAIAGYLLGKLSVKIINKINIQNGSLYPILLLSIALLTFAATTLCKGNGYLAVYIAGLVIGNTKIVHKKSISTFFDGFAWLWQIVMFITLGLLVNPHELIPVSGIGLSIGVFMMLIARPLSVFISLLPFRNISFKGKLYISWVGLRGAVPIIFATYPLIAGIDHAHLFFNIVFFITILSLSIQGTTVASFAKWLKLIETPEKEPVFAVEFPDEIKSKMCEMEVKADMLGNGKRLIDIDIPEHSLVVMIKRGQSFFIPNGKTELKTGDVLLIISDDITTMQNVKQVIGLME